MEHIISVKGFSKNYKDFNAVDNINLSIEKGSIFGLLGPNGAGKTTTIKAITGRLTPTTGEISVLGLDVSKNTKEVHKQIGVVSEFPNLYKDLTVFENIDFFRELFSLDKSKTDEIIDQLELTDKRDVRVSKLSKGLRQRTLLARSIIHSPKVLFLDEPTSGLDPKSSLAVYEFIKELKERGTTIFLTTHYMEEADLLCDHVAFINKGKIVASGTPKLLKSKFGNKTVDVCFMDDEGEKNMTHVLNHGEDLVSVAEFHKGHELLSIHSKEATMNDVFISLINQSH